MSGHVFHSAGVPLIPVYRSEGKPHKIQYVNKRNKHLEEGGGGGGIRTRETIHHRLHALQACAFDRSATPPRLVRGCFRVPR